MSGKHFNQFANLAGGFDAFTDTEVDDDPSEQQTQTQVPLHHAHIIYTSTDTQRFVPETCRLHSTDLFSIGF